MAGKDRDTYEKKYEHSRKVSTYTKALDKKRAGKWEKWRENGKNGGKGVTSPNDIRGTSRNDMASSSRLPDTMTGGLTTIQ